MLSYVIFQLHSNRAAAAAAAAAAATIFSKTGICSVDALVCYREHLNNSNNNRKKTKSNKKQAQKHINKNVLEMSASKWYALILHLAQFCLTPYVQDVYYYITLGNRQELKTLFGSLGLLSEYQKTYKLFCGGGWRITAV